MTETKQQAVFRHYGNYRYANSNKTKASGENDVFVHCTNA